MENVPTLSTIQARKQRGVRQSGKLVWAGTAFANSYLTSHCVLGLRPQRALGVYELRFEALRQVGLFTMTRTAITIQTTRLSPSARTTGWKDRDSAGPDTTHIQPATIRAQIDEWT